MINEVFRYKITDEIPLKLDLMFFNSKALRFEEDTFYNNDESDIFMFFEFNLLNERYFNDKITLNEFIRQKELPEITASKILKITNSFYSNRLDKKLLIKLKNENLLISRNGEEILNSREKIFKAIYINHLYNKEFKEEVVKIMDYLLNNGSISIEKQHVRFIFNKDNLIYFSELDRNSLEFGKTNSTNLVNLTFSLHAEYSKDRLKDRIEFIQSKPFNYLDLTNGDKINRDGFNKSITVLLDLSQLISKTYEQFDSIFNENVRLFVSNPYVDNSIIYTLLETPESFHIFHNGIAVVCSSFSFASKKIILEKINIVNGAQTIFNISKLVKLGIIDFKFLKDRYVLAKIIEVDGSKSEEMRMKISRAANTQKAINLQDLKSNHIFLISYRNLLSRYYIDLLIKRGLKAQLPNVLKVEKFAKIVYSSMYQKPGYSRNASLDVFFDENKVYFKQIFEFDILNQVTNNIRVLIVHIYLYYLNNEEIYSKLIGDSHKYAELYFVSYVFGRIILEDINIKDILNTSDENIMNLDLINEKMESYSNTFIEKLIDNKELLDNAKSLFNVFKNDDLYKRIFPDYGNVTTNVSIIINRDL